MDFKEMREDAQYKASYTKGFNEGFACGKIVADTPMTYANKASIARENDPKNYPYACGLARGFASGFYKASLISQSKF